MVEEVANREQAVGADERQDLIRGDEKRDRVDDPEQAQDDESGSANSCRDQAECAPSVRDSP